MATGDFLHQVGVWLAIWHAIIGTFIPLMIVVVLTWFGTDKSYRDGFAVAPFAIFAGLSFTVPYLLIAIFVGPELPSLLGALIGLAVTIFGARRGFLQPKAAWNFAPRESWNPGGRAGPGQNGADLRLSPSTGLHRARPARVPRFTRGEIPGCFRLEKSTACSEDRNRETDQRSEQ